MTKDPSFVAGTPRTQKPKRSRLPSTSDQPLRAAEAHVAAVTAPALLEN